MRNLKLLTICFVVFGLFTGNLLACDPFIGINLEGFFTSDGSTASVGQVGDEIEYTVIISLDPDECPISNGEVKLFIPDNAGTPSGLEIV